MFSIMRKNRNLVFLVCAIATFGALSCSLRGQQSASTGANKPVALELKVPPIFSFVAYGDTRFHDPTDHEASNPPVRQALVAAIDKERPAFVSIGGDIVYVGENPKDWEVWDAETSAWREHKIALYPALGNHDLKGNEKTALDNYFQRFPELQRSRYYSVRMGNTIMLILDSALDEVSGPQGEWLRKQLATIPANVDFVFFVFHHPPYTSSSDEKTFGGGHSARTKELDLANLLEEKQKTVRARFLVFSGHVHNYERHEHGGVIYFVTGGGGAHAYPVTRKETDLYRDNGVNYHYLLVEVDHNKLKVTMNKVEIQDGKQVWTKPDSIAVTVQAALPAAAD